ncbi:hypothetical protein CDD82_6530 [Ophiocordyceps australis]|uniref:Protein BTN n=1 Tax=Ophiocordyceps australis TaxID=1399860 RepID=A0A2C5XGC4_9HYPO|nr:hypothetical protein CDD82_6530 [Ophiocordyceps australis]
MPSYSPSSSGLLPMPGAPSSSWAVFAARIKVLAHHADTKVFAAFWLLGLINNVLFVIILSAAQDLVGTLPKGIVLLADVMPSFAFKLVSPYFIARVPYSLRVAVMIALSVTGMLLLALTPPSDSPAVKMVGVAMASLSSGMGEMSFLGLSHFYGQVSLVGWGSGTGAAGLVGAGLYVVLTEWWRLSVQQSLLLSACLPALMFVSFFCVLPKPALQSKDYEALPGDGDELDAGVDDARRHMNSTASSSLLAQDTGRLEADSCPSPVIKDSTSLAQNLRRAQALFVPYMAPLFLVYVAEYTINQGVTPTLLFPVEASPFRELRGFYPFYGFLYQLGVFISRSSTPFLRIHQLYLPSLLQVINLGVLVLQSLFYFMPSVYMVFVIVFWEGLLGGAVYVNCFAEIMEQVPPDEREFSLSATTVSDSAGTCIAGLVSIVLETRLCDYQVAHGRDWCKKIKVQQG